MITKIISLFCIFFFSFSALAESTVRPYQLPNSDTISLKDKTTSRLYDIYIQLPDDYSATKKYPVIYMTDAWYTFPIISGSVRVPVGSSKMQSVILVGISEEINLSIKESRFRDYTPTLMSGWSNKTGEAKAHIEYIRNQVIPHIEKTYSTDPDQRTYVGISLGGLFGAYILMTQPDTFANYILASPSLWFNNEQLLKMEAEYAEKHTDLKARVYVSVGSRETPAHKQTVNNMVKGAEDFTAALKSRNYKNLRLQMKVVDSANHEISFPTSAIHGLYWLFNTEK